MVRTPRIQWPNGARIAVVLQVAFEQYQTDNPDYYNQASRLTSIPLLPKELVAQGHPDLLLQSWDEYADVGLRRITDLLDRHGVTGTLVCSGLAAQRYPESVKAFHRGGGGREVCAHSWSQDLSPHTLDREQMRKNARRCADAIEHATGVRPVGWVGPGGQHNADTTPALADEGFIWQGDYANTDGAFLIDAEGRKMVGMSLPWDVNDVMYVRFRTPPSHYVELFCRSFDVLYQEGGGILPAVNHCTIYGRPFGIWAYDQIIKYAKSFPGVWITTRRAIAEYCLEQYG